MCRINLFKNVENYSDNKKESIKIRWMLYCIFENGCY